MQVHSARSQDKIWSANTEPFRRDDADILTAAIGNERVAEAWIKYFGNLAGVAATSLSVLHVVAEQVDPDCADAAIERLLTIHAYPQSAEHELDHFSFDWLPLVPPHSVLSALEDYLYNGGDEVDNETTLILQRIRAQALRMTLKQRE